jgi:hypothetical protein
MQQFDKKEQNTSALVLKNVAEDAAFSLFVFDLLAPDLLLSFVACRRHGSARQMSR